MNIIHVAFEEPLFLSICGETVQLIAFKTPEHGNIKFGIEAPRSVSIHREEIHLAILKQKADSDALENG